MSSLIDTKTIHQARVLIVDDQSTNVLLLRKMLQADGYRNVQGTIDPTEVRALHGEHPFDIILLDIRMPKLDGFGVMAQLREVHQEDDYVAILVLTAQTDEATRLRALECGRRISSPSPSTGWRS